MIIASNPRGSPSNHESHRARASDGRLRADLAWVQNAGSVFVGRWSAQPMGDYISGPNHTLPTGGMARVRGGLSVNDFVKLITVQEYSAQGIAAARTPRRTVWPRPRDSPVTLSPSALRSRQGGRPWLSPSICAPSAARARSGDEGVSSAARQSRFPAARLQREHACLFARSTRSARRHLRGRPHALSRSGSPLKPSLPRILACARAGGAHQWRRRSHPCPLRGLPR